MADIELVVKIPKEMYKNIQSKSTEVQAEGYTVENAILNGTPLPKGHGRLMILSEDEVKRELTSLNFSCQNWISEVGLWNATLAIIEADKEYKNETGN